MKLTMEPCPCGRCDKFVIRPMFFSQDAAVTKKEAGEIIKRWNTFDGLRKLARAYHNSMTPREKQNNRWQKLYKHIIEGTTDG